MNTSKDVDQYIEGFSGEVKARLVTLREIVRAEVPEAEEGFMYGLAGYKLSKKPLVYFGGFKNHVGFYATPNGHEAFAEDFSKYRQGKGSVQFPLDQPLPVELIGRVVRLRKDQVGGREQSDELPSIGQPATRALKTVGVTRSGQLKDYSESDLLALHGVGPRAIQILKEAGIRLNEN